MDKTYARSSLLGKRITVATIISVALIIAGISYSTGSDMTIEAIYKPAPFGFDVQFIFDDVIYSNYAVAPMLNSNDGSISVLAIPYGHQIGNVKSINDIRFERFTIFEMAGYDPCEWLYAAYTFNGVSGYLLYKADSLSEVPESISELCYGTLNASEPYSMSIIR